MLFRQEFLHRSSYTGVFTEIVYTGVPIQEFLYRSHYTGVLPLMFLQRSFTQDFLQRSCSTGVVTQKLTSKWSTSETPCKAPTSQALLIFFLRQQGQPKTCLRNLTAEIVHVGCANVWWNVNFVGDGVALCTKCISETGVKIKLQFGTLSRSNWGEIAILQRRGKGSLSSSSL